MIVLWDAFTSASYQSLGKEALSGWKKKKGTFFTLTILPRESFGLAVCPRCRGVAWCWSLPRCERGCGDTHAGTARGRCHQTSQGHPAATSGWGSAWPRRLERGCVGTSHAPPRRKGWRWFGGPCVALALLVSPSAGMRALGMRAGMGAPPWGAVQNQTQMKPIGQVMGESWELGRGELRKKRGFMCCNPRSSPTLAGFQ